MLKPFDLRAVFEMQGSFWRPDTPSTNFPGRLIGHKHRIELVTAPSLTNIGDVTELPGGEARIDVLHGLTTSGPCTLFWLQSAAPKGLTDFDTDQSLSFREYRVALCVFGSHIPDSTRPVLRSVCCRYSGLSEWLPVRPQRSETEKHIVLIHAKDTPPVFDVCVRNLKARIRFDIIPYFTHRSTGEYHTRNDVQLLVEPSNPQSLEWFLDLAYRLENLFSLLLGVSICLRSVALDEDAAWVVQRVRYDPQKVHPMLWITCSAADLVRTLLLWLSTPAEFRSLENLIYGTMRNTSAFVETEFLSLAQAIESFHRLTDASTVAHPRCFRDILKSLQEETDHLCAGTKLAARLNESMQYANEPNFRMRIENLIARMNQEQQKQLLGDPKEFEQTLRQTRNNLTHPGITKKAKVLTKPKELFLFNQKLRAFLRLLMLMHVGFASHSVFEPVLYQAKRWH